MSAAAAEKRANGDARPYFDAAKGRWYVAVELPPGPDGRRRRRKVGGATAAEARAAARAARSQLAAGLPLPPGRRTTGDFLSWWADEALPGTVGAGTAENYRDVLRLYVLPHLGRVPLAKLGPGDVTRMLRALEAAGHAPNTQRLARSVLRRALRRAEAEGHVARNVAALADGPRVPQAEGRTLTPAEARSLLDAARGDRLEAAYVVALALGLRRGEVLGLAWADVDLEGAATLTVRRGLRRIGGRLVLGDVKTARSRRTLHLPAPVVEALRAHRARQAAERLVAGPAWADSGLVVTTALGAPFDPDNLRHRVSRLATRAGLGHWSPHELRHSAASLLLAMGVPLEVVSETLGHSSIRVTKDVYGHLLAPARQAAAEAMGRALWG